MVPSPRILEINVISAHDLALVSKSMKTYAVAWVDPERKVATRVDQSGINNPNWNEKFVFRVNDRYLTDETSAIMIEIYAAAWLKDALIGSVRVLISHIFGTLTNSSSTTRYVALQVRRPSGRPQGIINMGITILDNKMRSLPIFGELCAAGGNFSDLSSAPNEVKPQTKQHKDDQDLEKSKTKENRNAKLRRSNSDGTDLASEDNAKQQGSVGGASSAICNCSASLVKGNGSVVNGSQCSSDIGPSASVVAGAIAKGLYKTPSASKTPTNNGGGVLVTEEWTAKENEEGLKSKVERLQKAQPLIYDHSKFKANCNRGGRARRKTDSKGLFSCFGNSFGCEISISCGGGGGNIKRKYRNGNNKVCHLSSVDDNYSQSYV